jgi:hypothetical protein
VKVFLAIVLALPLLAQAPAGQADPTSELAAERHRKAVELVEVTGSRDRLVAAIPEMIEQGKAEMRKNCPDCRPEYLTEWGKRMAVRFKADDFVSIAARAYEKRFTSDELSQFVAVAVSQKTDKPVSPSVVLQRKLEDRLPAILGEIAEGCSELGARLGAEVGAEILKEHPEYAPSKAK